MEYRLVKADSTEVDAAMGLIDQARAFLAEQHIDQWQSGYPDINCISHDVEIGQGYFMVDENDTKLCYLFLDCQRDPEYDLIYDGAWLNVDANSYIAAHRVATATGLRGRGIGSNALLLAEQLGRNIGRKSFRIDTHEDNVIMQHVLDKLGFTQCGIVMVRDGKRLAYEKLLD